mgnify:CR=1 FL=1
MVNPYAVKQTKELDDNSQSKNDCKDPKVIAKLVIEGRYSAPYTPDGVYADLRVLTNNRKRIIRELTQIKNRFARWFSIYFPEFRDVFKDYEKEGSMLVLIMRLVGLRRIINMMIWTNSSSCEVIDSVPT